MLQRFLWRERLRAATGVNGLAATFEAAQLVAHSVVASNVDVVLKMERRFSGKGRAGDRRTPVPLDVLDYQIRAAEMIGEGAHARAIHRVGHVAHDEHV